jgi:hypothetical protein
MRLVCVHIAQANQSLNASFIRGCVSFDRSTYGQQIIGRLYPAQLRTFSLAISPFWHFLPTFMNRLFPAPVADVSVFGVPAIVVPNPVFPS